MWQAGLSEKQYKQSLTVSGSQESITLWVKTRNSSKDLNWTDNSKDLFLYFIWCTSIFGSKLDWKGNITSYESNVGTNTLSSYSQALPRWLECFMSQIPAPMLVWSAGGWACRTFKSAVSHIFCSHLLNISNCVISWGRPISKYQG